ncbi:hypothetical protein AYO45_06930 [Gammaproteobacteria bacterium SCGC AG-212-F23]|nr:hypothetical protein AYO45_06930 [Gammaproteobacteria bacterium SCGC AG-212-F23]
MKIKTLSLLCASVIISTNSFAAPQSGSSSLNIQTLSHAMQQIPPTVAINPDATVVYGGRDITHHS